MHSNSNSRILVIGSGFGGVWSALSSARALHESNRKDVEVAVIAPEPSLLIRVRLYESDISTVKPSIKDLFEAVGVRYIRGFVTQIRNSEREVVYTDPDSSSGPQILTYDRLVLASGSKVIKPDIPGLEFAFVVDNYADAIKLNEHLLALKSKPQSTARSTVVIAGAGFTGLETATEMVSRLRAIFGDGAFKVIMVERNASVGPDLGPGPRPVIEKALKELGISVYTGESVASVQEDAVITSSGRIIETNTCIWTAGVQASDLTSQLVGASLDRTGRLQVDRNLQVEGVQDVFAAGDTARGLTDEHGHYTMMSCQHAIPMGKTAGHNAAQHLLGLPLTPYSQPFYTTCLDLGEGRAVVANGWHREVWMEGSEAKKMKKNINTELVYPPTDRETAFTYANPALQGVIRDGKFVYEL